MSQLKEYIKIAWISLRNNRGRSLLTMLGIIIGISSVIVIISLGNGVKDSVIGSMNDMFTGQIYLYSTGDENETTDLYFNEDDLVALREKVKHLKAVSPCISGYVITSNGRSDINGYINLCSPDYDYSYTEPLLRGRYFTQDEYEARKPVCVLREASAMTLFGTTDVVGMTVEVTTLNGDYIDLLVVGVRKKTDSQMQKVLYEEDSVEMDIPYSLMNEIIGYDIPNTTVLMIADSAETSAQVTADAIKLMEARKNVRNEKKFQAEEFTDASKTVELVVNCVTLFIAFVAAISLLVGGIGVMNIMLVSVTERTREIGIRKSLGARTSSILLQFLAEAALLTLIGGIIGMLAGVFGAKLVCFAINAFYKLGLNATIGFGTVLAVSTFSTAIGLFFGIYPAKKAAQLSPIEALRHD